jgi:uncharacterized protein (TIGR02678 family)
MNVRELDAEQQRRIAFRALLAAPFVGTGEEAFPMIRRHEPELARIATDVFGYRLHVGPTAARLVGAPTHRSARRPLRVPPASESGRKRPRDEWPRLSDRGAVLLLCILAALERGGAQTALAELARDTAAAAADCDPPIAIDFEARAERLAFADGLELLVSWGVVEHTAGSKASYRSLDASEDEAFLTVDRRRLVALLRDPAQALAADGPTGIDTLGEGYAPTVEGARRSVAHELARRLVEDPVLLLDELDDGARTYFLGQRARIEDAVASATGLDVERRAEGTALVTDDRALTDLPFPTRSTAKQVALLLCDALHGEARSAPAANGVVARERVLALVRGLVAEHRPHWQRDPKDPVAVAALAADAVATLVALDLVAADSCGALRLMALAHRFRDPAVQRASEDTS